MFDNTYPVCHPIIASKSLHWIPNNDVVVLASMQRTFGNIYRLNAFKFLDSVPPAIILCECTNVIVTK